MEEPKLLIDGRQAFPEVIRCIRAAERRIEINMFIWRDDEIGNRLAAELLRAAERGVRVELVKDRYGLLCEYAEECQRSLFHARPTVGERVNIWGLELLYNRDLLFRERPRGENALCRALRAHPNVAVSAEVCRRDHSKFYIFDDAVLILGGINVEDKENGADRAGRRYRDYMVELRGEETVRAFRRHRTQPDASADAIFACNLKCPVRRFELRDRLLALIDGAERELTILMAYFSPDAQFLSALRAAAGRGVRVRLLMPARANFTDASNKRTLCALCGCEGLTLYLSDRMVHAKLFLSEKTIAVGSCNISKKAFGELDELDVFWPNDGGAFAQAVRASVEETVAEAARVTGPEMLRHNALLAWMESLLM